MLFQGWGDQPVRRRMDSTNQLPFCQIVGCTDVRAGQPGIFQAFSVGDSARPAAKRLLSLARLPGPAQSPSHARMLS